MIHVFIGTKAQYVKTAPLLRSLDASAIPYNLIDSGQHAQIAQEMREELQVRAPDVFLRAGDDITGATQALWWALKNLLPGLVCAKRMSARIFRNEGGVCVVHGDTLTTLLSVALAKRAGLKIAHIEAGLRSYNYFNPFPEEAIRVITMRLADLLFTPSDWAYSNLEKMNVKGRVINLGVNTAMEAVAFSLSRKSSLTLSVDHYCLVTIHRVETIYNVRRMRYIVDLLSRISQSKPVVFVLHGPTERSLKRFHLFEALEKNENVTLLSLLAHTDFIHVAKNADFIITDGGSIQEESFYLNVPCLIMRKKTERQEGMNHNAYLSEFDESRVDHFLAACTTYRHEGMSLDVHPTQTIIEYLREYV